MTDAQQIRAATPLAGGTLRNGLHTVLLLGGIGAIVAAGAYALAGSDGLLAAGLVLAGIAIGGPRLPPEAVMRLYRAEPLPPAGGSQLVQLVALIADRAGLPVRPALYVVPSAALAAFTSGSPDRAAIAVTEGLLRRLTLRELAGVLAHEISHIRSGDLGVMAVADILTRISQGLAYVAVLLALSNVIAIVNGDRLVAWWLIVLLYLAPLACNLLQLSLSRSRELEADLDAARLTGDPMGLASALNRIDPDRGQLWDDVSLPVPARRIPHPSLLRSHPPSTERVARLVELSRQPMPDPIVLAEEPMVSMVGWGPASMRPRYRWPGIWY